MTIHQKIKASLPFLKSKSEKSHLLKVNWSLPVGMVKLGLNGYKFLGESHIVFQSICVHFNQNAVNLDEY